MPDSELFLSSSGVMLDGLSSVGWVVGSEPNSWSTLLASTVFELASMACTSATELIAKKTDPNKTDAAPIENLRIEKRWRSLNLNCFMFPTFLSLLQLSQTVLIKIDLECYPEKEPTNFINALLYQIFNKNSRSSA